MVGLDSVLLLVGLLTRLQDQRGLDPNCKIFRIQLTQLTRSTRTLKVDARFDLWTATTMICRHYSGDDEEEEDDDDMTMTLT